MGTSTKKLVGIKRTPEMMTLVQSCLDLSPPPRDDDTNGTNNTENGSAAAAAAAKNKSSASARSRACAPLPISEARSILKRARDEPVSNPLPLSVVKAMNSIIISSSVDGGASSEQLLRKLESALAGGTTTLSYTTSNPETLTDEQKKFRQRIDRLRLKAEESRYKSLTKNLDTTVADDVNTKSMTYAASVGLNMIVAPISFGIFMYFFAGQMFNWLSDKEDDDNAARADSVDIRRVIAGVVCGVGMLFIEMTLFVIRSHEFDRSLRKKARREGPNPFGYSKERQKLTYGLKDE